MWIRTPATCRGVFFYDVFFRCFLVCSTCRSVLRSQSLGGRGEESRATFSLWISLLFPITSKEPFVSESESRRCLFLFFSFFLSAPSTRPRGCSPGGVERGRVTERDVCISHIFILAKWKPSVRFLREERSAECHYTPCSFVPNLGFLFLGKEGALLVQVL